MCNFKTHSKGTLFFATTSSKVRNFKVFRCLLILLNCARHELEEEDCSLLPLLVGVLSLVAITQKPSTNSNQKRILPIKVKALSVR